MAKPRMYFGTLNDRTPRCRQPAKTGGQLHLPYPATFRTSFADELPGFQVIRQCVDVDFGGKGFQPFSIDLDEQLMDWSDEEREMLAEDPELAWLTQTVPGGAHSRPDGGEQRTDRRRFRSCGLSASY